MRNETRTRKQIDADRIDLEAYRLIISIESFAEEQRDADLTKFATMIEGWRHRIRKYMHPKDREATR